MKIYTCFEKPLKVFGVPFFEEKKKFERLPKEVREKVPILDFLGRRCPGARVGFRTNAEEFTVRVTLRGLTPDIAMSIYSCQSVSVMIGERNNSSFAGLVYPPDYNTKTFEKSFKKSNGMEEVTLWLVRNEEIENVEVIFPDEAEVIEPTPYKYEKVLYYGSSITEGGCTASTTNTYTAILSRWLDMDYYNFGFAGSAKGELEIADYITTIDKAAFVFDYDHNAPTAEYLKNTHEPFFRHIREKEPTIPILMLSRPNFDYSEDGNERRNIIKCTYENALKNGDKNVYFIDGESFFGDKDRHLCTIDTIHPNDLGSYRMAEVILPVMKKMLGVD